VSAVAASALASGLGIAREIFASSQLLSNWGGGKGSWGGEVSTILRYLES